MYYNVVSLRTDNSGASLVTAGISDVNQAASQADDLNRGSLQVMSSNKPGAERSIPDMVYAAGYGPKITDDEGAPLPPYHGEISRTTAQVLSVVQERLARYGEEGVVRFSAREAAPKVSTENSHKQSSLTAIFDRVRMGAETIENIAAIKQAPRPAGPAL